MQETLLALFEPLKSVNPIIYTIIIAFVPLIELRGSIPAAMAMGIPVFEASLWSLAGSIIPAFFVIPLFSWGLDFLAEKKWFPWLTDFLNRKFVTKAQQVSAQHEALDQSSQSALKKELLKFWSIVIFVGIPLPGTGVWTGAAVASIIKMPFGKALLAVFLGDVLAALAVALISVGVFSFF